MAGIKSVYIIFEVPKNASILIPPFVNLSDILSVPLSLKLISYKPQSYTKVFAKGTKGLYRNY